MATVDNSTVAPTTAIQSDTSETAAAATQHELSPAEAALTRLASTTTTESAPSTAAAAETEVVDDSHSSSAAQPLNRRHSLPTSFALNNFLFFWNGGEVNLHSNHPAGTAPQAHHTEASDLLEQSGDNSTSREYLGAIRSSSAGRDTSGVSGSSGNVNRHRYGHRHTKSAHLNQPVIVKTYEPPPSSTGMGSSAIPKDWQKNRVELPSVESFSFSGILKAVEPQVNEAIDGVSEFFHDYREKIKTETDVVDDIQSQIEGRWKDLKKLSTSVEKTKKERDKKITSVASNLDYAILDELSQAADRSYSTLESIISTLLAIDEMLPPSEQITSFSSKARIRYPRVCKQVTDKSNELLEHSTPTRSTHPTSVSLRPPYTPIAQTPTSPRFFIRYSEHDQDSAIELDSPPQTNTHHRRFSAASFGTKSLGSRRTSLPPQVQFDNMVPEPSSPNPSTKSPVVAFSGWMNRPQTTGAIPGSPSSPTVGFLNRTNSFGSAQARRLSFSLGSLFSLRVSPVVCEETPWGLEPPREDEAETAEARLRRLIGSDGDMAKNRAKRRSMIY